MLVRAALMSVLRQPECLHPATYSVVGSRASDGHLPSDLLWRSQQASAVWGFVATRVGVSAALSFAAVLWLSDLWRVGAFVLAGNGTFLSNAFTALA